MNDVKTIQTKIDQLAGERKYWREIANGLGDAKGSPVVNGLTRRIRDKIAVDTSALKIADPLNAVAVAIAQTSIRTCEQILSDFDMRTCIDNISTLDHDIQVLKERLLKAVEKKESAPVGFDVLISTK